MLCTEAWADSQLQNPMCYITKADGLSGLSGGKSITDHLGRVWMATTNGVTLYNGKQTYSFSLYSDTGTPFSVFDLIEMPDGTLLVTTKEHIFALQPGANQFKAAYTQIKHPTSFLLQGHKLYVGSYDGLFCITKGKVIRIPTGYPIISTENVVYALQGDHKGNVWFLTSQHANCYNPTTHRRKACDIGRLLPAETKCNQFYIGRNTWLFGTKNNGLWIYFPATGQIKPVEGVSNVICRIAPGAHNTVCVSADGTGAYLIDALTGRILEHFGKQEVGSHHLETDGIYYYRRDKNGVDWFGLNMLGVAHTYYSYPLFKPYSYGSFSTEGQFIKGFYNQGGILIIGTSDNMTYIDEQRHICKTFPCSLYGNAHSITNIIKWRNKYYIGSYDAGLHVLNATTLNFEQQHLPSILSSCTIGALAIAPDGNLWIGSSQGLFILTPGGTVTRYTEQNSKVPGSLITGIVFDRLHNAWISSGTGFALYFPSKHYFENSNFPKGFFNTAQGLTVVKGPDNLIYGVTNQKVYYSDYTMNHFGKVDLPQGIMEEKCAGVVSDATKHLWIASENGVFRLDTRTRTLSRFGRAEGLNADIINKLYIDDQQRVWVATANGLYTMPLTRLRHWRRNVNIRFVLYHITMGGNRVDYAGETKINNKKQINVSWNLFSDEVHMMPIVEDYAYPKGRLYEYRLDNSDHWQLLAGGKDITLRNLQLGSYKLYLRIAGTPGTESVFKVKVRPSAMAIVELIIVLLFVGVLIYLRRYHHYTRDLLTERDDMEKALIEADQLQQQEELEHDGALPAEQTDEEPAEAAPAKYQHMQLDSDWSADIVQKMQHLMEDKKLYLNPNLKMSNVANLLHISPTRLSQVFSQVIGQNYYDYVNGYRLREFKRLIDEGEYKRYTLISLSAKCGFKKTSFFSTFHKVEGMTPTEYLKKLNKHFPNK